MSYRTSFIKHTAEYTLVVPNGSTAGAVAVTAGEDLNYCTLDIQGWTAENGSGAGGAGSTGGDMYAYLTASGSTIVGNRAGFEGDLTLKLLVTEYFPYAMRQPVQRGSITIGGLSGTTQTSTAYAATGAKTAVRQIGWNAGASNNVQGNSDSGVQVVKVDATHCRIIRLAQTYANTVGFEIVDWK